MQLGWPPPPPGRLLATECRRRLQVSRAWRSVASSEALWQQQCRQLEPHHHLARDDLLPGERRLPHPWRRLGSVELLRTCGPGNATSSA